MENAKSLTIKAKKNVTLKVLLTGPKSQVVNMTLFK